MSRDSTVIAFRQPDDIDDPLTERAREGARHMLAQVLIAEADVSNRSLQDFHRASKGRIDSLLFAR
jgi:hypothetical protein